MASEGYDNTRFEIPVNKTAYRVFSKGIRHRPEKKLVKSHFDAPPEIRKSLPDSPNFVDLTGVSFGRLTVVGMSEHRNKMWVCRCSCGKYVFRTTKAVKNPENWGDRCCLCNHLAYLKRKRLWQDTGKRYDLRAM